MAKTYITFELPEELKQEFDTRTKENLHSKSNVLRKLIRAYNADATIVGR